MSAISRSVIPPSPTHPGEYVRKDVLQRYKMTREQLAQRLGVPWLRVQRLCSSQGNMSPEMALRLERLTGTPATEWMALQTKLDIWRAKQEFEDDLMTITRLSEASKN